MCREYILPSRLLHRLNNRHGSPSKAERTRGTPAGLNPRNLDVAIPPRAFSFGNLGFLIPIRRHGRASGARRTRGREEPRSSSTQQGRSGEVAQGNTRFREPWANRGPQPFLCCIFRSLIDCLFVVEESVPFVGSFVLLLQSRQRFD